MIEDTFVFVWKPEKSYMVRRWVDCVIVMNRHRLLYVVLLGTTVAKIDFIDGFGHDIFLPS